VVIDFASRVGEIQNSYQAGENWEREMFIESASFASSAITGEIVATGGAAVAEAALVCFLGATPAGWVLVIVGLAVAGVAAGASIYANNKIKKEGGAWYDSIMKWLGKVLWLQMLLFLQ
jgi:urocanate hydratase